MGWTSYHASHYNKHGQINRKAECDAYFEDGLNKGHYQVLKSAMYGTTYYAAVRPLTKYVGKNTDGSSQYKNLEEDEARVFAAVFLTQVNMDDYYNFSYKDMTESISPAYYNCPKSILNLLSPTDNEYALSWRKRCEEYYDHKKKLKTLKDGSLIRFKAPYNMANGIMAGDEVKLMKNTICSHSRWFFDHRTFWKENHIPLGFEVVSIPQEEEAK